MSKKEAESSGPPDRQSGHGSEFPRSFLIALVAVGGAVVWAYWPTLTRLAAKWGSDPQYSHGYLVPFFAMGLLWMRRSEFDARKLEANWWGLLLLLFGVGLRLAGGYFYFDWFDAISLMPVIAGVCLLMGGSAFLIWTLPAIAFLFFMIPLPYRLEVLLQQPLRHIGTVASVYIMQTIGLPALGEGNIIVLGEHRLGVAEACSGLRMLMIFFALTTAVAMVSPRPWWERLVIVVSAVPIALVTNVVRISVTGSLMYMDYSEIANLVFHDLAGWLMMPFALLLLWFEFWFLSHIVIAEEDKPMSVALEGDSHANA